jgi:hypothetical protein
VGLGSFYLHEDEWAMIDLVPSENRAECQASAAAGKAFGEAHRAPGGGWTDVYVHPEVTHGIAERRLTVADLEGLLGWPRYQSVASGYGGLREPVPRAFAFGDGRHVLYGSVDADGIVTGLHLFRRAPELRAKLVQLGAAQRLIAIDWWRDQVIPLDDDVATAAWLRDDD